LDCANKNYLEMKMTILRSKAATLLAVFACVSCTETLEVADPLPSWNDSATRQEIVAFVEKTTTELKIPEPGFNDDKEGKPVAIHQHIGRQPTMAFGNSDGDFQMLEWSTAGGGPRLGVLVHHDDADASGLTIATHTSASSYEALMKDRTGAGSLSV
jgi:hypothetical protein